MPPQQVVHTITPGDHFSPRTGSAIPTVVHGISSAALAMGDFQQAVVIDRATYRPRYRGVDIIEYTGGTPLRRGDRRRDIISGWTGRPRVATAASYQPVADAVAQLTPSIVLAHNAPIMPWLLRESEHRVILYAHNELFRTYSRAELSRTLDSMAGIVCVSESLAHATRRRLPKKLAARVTVVRNGSDTERFSPATVAKSADRPVQVVFVGRVIPDKGADVLARAAALVRSTNVEFTVVGSSGFARDFPLSDYELDVRRVAKASVHPFRFEPFVDRSALPAMLRATDILVIPSRWPDPCPLTIGEGLASGLALIASKVGGIPEIISPTSRLVPPDDPAALAREIDLLAADPKLRSEIGVDARAWAQAHDWTWTWQTLKSILDAL